MKEEHQHILKNLEQSLIELERKREAANRDDDDRVSFSNYRSVVVALRRCQIILEDILPHLPNDKQPDVRIYLSVLGDMNADVATYSGINYLHEFVLPTEAPYRQQYANIKDPKFSPRGNLEEIGAIAPVLEKKTRKARPAKRKTR